MESLPVDPGGIQIMAPKGEFCILKTDPISAPAANILKQQMLSVGGECAVSRGASTCEIDTAPAILSGTKKQFLKLAESLEYQIFGLNRLSTEIRYFFADDFSITEMRIGGRHFDFKKKTAVMGVLNVTPDSFYDGGKHVQVTGAVKAALQMETDGADIIDIGGESTRPGAEPVDEKTELNRIIPVITGLRQKSNIPISIDTYKSAVAEKALEAGADMVNDISGLTFDPQLAEVIASHNAAACLMHIRGTPRNMQENPHYDNLIDEILNYLDAAVGRAVKAGLSRDQIIIDPGIGFGKTVADNYTILRYLKEFESLGQPILVGLSRKSLIGKLLDLPVDQRLPGSLAGLAVAINNGAAVIRVHDVRESRQAAAIADAIVGKQQI
ncbi:MAG TPA: dihydropteroate synthase [Candidatus Marinimicrobia bacterium]|nr:dihydropteroate synthase [Candidatus Neomarinimicrobiota bacterium]